MDPQLQGLYVRILKDKYKVTECFQWNEMYIVRIRKLFHLDETYVLRSRDFNILEIKGTINIYNHLINASGEEGA